MEIEEGGARTGRTIVIIAGAVIVILVLGFLGLKTGKIPNPWFKKLTSDGSKIEIKPVDPAGIKTVVDANNQFSLDLYNRYQKTQTGNIFFSPYSISTALAMTYEGAKDRTAEEMEKVFYFPKDAVIRREEFLKNYQWLNKTDKKYELKTANALWAQKDFAFLPDYLNLIEQYYGGKSTNLDFIAKTEESRQTINKWVEEQTNQKIKNLIPEGSITADSRLILTNAIYFKGDWTMKFAKSSTKKADFYIKPAEKIQTEMMNNFRSSFKYAEDSLLQLLEMNYEGDDLSMLVLLPKDKDLTKLDATLSTDKLKEWKTKLGYETVNVSFPKYKFEEKYFMSDDLKAMGMPTAFSDNADFSGMTGKKDLKIDFIIHQAFVDVNEDGTEAAAATGTGMATLSMETSEPEPKEFIADHPFIFLIQDKKTDEILFMGRVANPAE